LEVVRSRYDVILKVLFLLPGTRANSNDFAGVEIGETADEGALSNCNFPNILDGFTVVLVNFDETGLTDPRGDDGVIVLGIDISGVVGIDTSGVGVTDIIGSVSGDTKGISVFFWNGFFIKFTADNDSVSEDELSNSWDFSKFGGFVNKSNYFCFSISLFE